MPSKIMLIEDDAALRDLLGADLETRGYAVERHPSAEDALAALPTSDADIIVTDVQLKGMRGTELASRVKLARPDVLVVVITAFGSLDNAIAAIRAGAYDFITKPFETEALDIVLKRALEHRALRLEVKRLSRAVAEGGRFEEILGQSRAMQRVFDLLTQVSGSDVGALITGESGTGKELVARALHQRSKRKAGPFVAINCSAVPETLLETQLFGHAKGAFTDAKNERKGLFLQADGGTLFLDEIGDMPVSLQPKLLRALQERKVLPVGGDREMPFDVRVIAATHHDLEEAITDGRFRDDLFYRLNVVEIELPPLRERGGDVLLLAQRFLEVFAARANKPVKGISPPAAEKIMAYDWPGNVRELSNAMERAIALTRLDHISVDDLPARVQQHKATRLVVDSENPTTFIPLDELEKRYILRVLEACQGARKKAARILGIDRKTLYRKLVRWGATAGGDAVEHDEVA
jgi:DNA-binding NtrC family response regulator